MFNHIYGSPFPPINPRVRYKTALERAGFEVNYNGKPQGDVHEKPPSIQGMERHGNASTGSLNELAEPPKRSQSRVNSLPENKGKPGQQSQQRPRPPPSSQPKLQQTPPARSPVPSVQAPAQTQQSEVDPVEKSYMLLTRHNSTNTVDKSVKTSRPSSQELQRDTDSSHVSEQSNRPLTKDIPNFPETQEKVHDSDNDSVNIDPDPELQVSLGNNANNNNNKPNSVEDDQVPPLNVTSPPRPVKSPRLDAANVQVEKLIAQLDDVSLSKNAQLTNIAHPPKLPPLQTTGNGIANNKLKNSSAYMSGFQPPNMSSPIEQSISQEDVASDTGSTMTADTPLFYNFHKTVHQEFTQSPSLPQRPLHRFADPTPNLEFKYPPGTGPCRACGIEPTGKRIYSKKQNELSGQWHRDCFRCLACNIRFNKSVPCYILDDKPYCRRHYHEENSSICQSCREFIEGECVENDRMERFHTHCLLCFLCREPITNDYFIYNSQVPLCSNHDPESLPTELLGSNDSTVSKRRTRLINFS